MTAARYFINCSSLNLNVHFHVSKEKIDRVELFLSEQKGLNWQIFSLEPIPTSLVALLDQWLQSYAKGKQLDVELPLANRQNSSFSHLALAALQRVPFGSTVTYQQLAAAVGSPRAARAIGNACASNPCPLIIPCHRVVSTGGGIGGFTGELEIKRQLLAFEEQAGTL